MRPPVPFRRRLLAALGTMSLIAAPLGAQSSKQAAPVNPRQAPAPPPRPTPRSKGTIRTTVSLVEIDVQVTGRDGKPVKGLRRPQFSITEDGKTQKISTFEYNDIEQVETAGKMDETPISVPLGAVTAPEQIKAVVRDHRMIVLFFDLTSLEQEDLLRSTRAAQKYLDEQMTPADLVAVVAQASRRRHCPRA
jgi:VWFA-related protein